MAGGGSFIALPALLYAGVPPVAANATTTFALWPGTVASAVAYRSHLAGLRTTVAPFVVVSLAGGVLGGLLLMRTSDAGFLRILPWLMLLAAVTFTFSGWLSARLGTGGGPRTSHPWWGWLLLLAIATYGGYFGGGMGIMILAVMAISGMTDLHEMNGVKTVLAAIINGVALAEFVAFGAIAFGPGLLMAAGAVAGGYGGASLARRIPPRYLRACVIVVAWLLTAYFWEAQ